MMKSINISTTPPKQKKLLVSAKSNLSKAIGDLVNAIWEGANSGEYLELQRYLQQAYNAMKLG